MRPDRPAIRLFALAPSLLMAGSLSAQAPKPPKAVLSSAQSQSVGANVAEDPEILRALAPYQAEIRASFGLVLVQAPLGLPRGLRGEESPLGDWVTDAMRARAEAVTGSPVPFAITNAGGLRANLRPGPVKVGDLYEVMPFENELVVAEYTGAEIVQAIRDGLERHGGAHFSGVKVTLEGTPEKPVLRVAWADGAPIDPKAVVRVATSDYLYAGGDAFLSLKKGRRPFTTGLSIRQVLLDTCAQLGREGKELAPPALGRFEVPAGLRDALKGKALRF